MDYIQEGIEAIKKVVVIGLGLLGSGYLLGKFAHFIWQPLLNAL